MADQHPCVVCVWLEASNRESYRLTTDNLVVRSFVAGMAQWCGAMRAKRVISFCQAHSDLMRATLNLIMASYGLPLATVQDSPAVNAGKAN